MEHKFGVKFGMGNGGLPLLPCLLPPLAFMLGGVGIAIFAVTDYNSMVEFGMYDEEFMVSQLTYTLIAAIVPFTVGFILLIVLNILRHLYKTGYWDIYGFTYDDNKNSLQIHCGHKRREYALKDILDVKVQNRGINMQGQYSYDYYIRWGETIYGYMYVKVRENGKEMWRHPYGLIADAKGTKEVIIGLIANYKDSEDIFDTK